MSDLAHAKMGPMAVFDGITIEDFEKLPDALALNHELVDGRLVDVSGNTPIHNLLRDRMARLLAAEVERARLGIVITEQEYDFGGNAHGPDVSFIPASHADSLDLHRRVQRFVPHLAIEIASRHDTFDALLGKAKRYREFGTREVWIFSLPLRTAVHLSERGEVLLDENADFAPEQIPGFSIRIGELLNYR